MQLFIFCKWKCWRTERGKNCPVPQSGRIRNKCQVSWFLLSILSIATSGVSLEFVFKEMEAFSYRICAQRSCPSSPNVYADTSYFQCPCGFALDGKVFSSTTYPIILFSKGNLSGTSNIQSSRNILRFIVCMFFSPIKSSLLSYQTKRRKNCSPPPLKREELLEQLSESSIQSEK